MDERKRTWRSTAWKFLAVLALLILYSSFQQIGAGKIPPPGPERHGFLIAAIGLPLALLGTSLVLFVSERTRR